MFIKDRIKQIPRWWEKDTAEIVKLVTAADPDTKPGSIGSVLRRERMLRNSGLEIVEPVKEPPPVNIDYQEFAREILDQYSHLDRDLKSPKREDIFKGRLEEVAVLHLSDVHCGKVNYFQPLDGTPSYPTYNEEIMYQQMDRLIESIASVNLLLSGNYDLKHLHICATGDLLEGDIIFKGQRFFIDAGAGLQVVRATDLFERFTLEMLKTFETVTWVIVPGNHGRMTQGREAHPFYNNLEWLMAQMLKRGFRDEERVTIISPESWYYMHRIYGWKYFLHHGNSVFSWMGIPYYGIQRQGKSRRTEVDMDIEMIGHFHQRMEIPMSSKSFTLVSGSWIEKSDFAWNKFGILSKAEQIYFGVSPKRPRTWSFDLELRPRGEAA